MLRGFLGVFCGLGVWSCLWYALNWVLFEFFPRPFHPDGPTDNFILSLFIVLLSFDFSFISGYINAIIAKNHQLRFAVYQGVIQLALGVNVQILHWGTNPLWFHVTFLILIFPAVLVGALYRNTSNN